MPPDLAQPTDTPNHDALIQKQARRVSVSQNQMMVSFIERNQSSFDLSSLSLDGPSNSDQMKMQMEMETVLLEAYGQGIEKGFILADLLPFLTEGVSMVVDDGFHRCFQENPVRPWNWTPTLYFFWCIGVGIRFGVIFPLRVLILILGLLFTALGFLLGSLVCKADRRNDWNCKCIMFLANAVVFSWTGLIKFHGKLPERKSNQIYAANHTSMIDVIVLLQKAPFSIVGQHHEGWVAFFQDKVLACLKPIWFRRSEMKDRSITATRIQDHIKHPEGNRLLIFPEGTCVNNEYCVQFKKGIFEMDAEICPIAIKYNKQYVDAFWNSRARPFHLHLFDLMTGWAVVADVWFLQPVSRHADESAIEFAARTKKMISDQAGLINVDWDGYMKYLLPSGRFLQKRQKLFADSVLSKVDLHLEPTSAKKAALQSGIRFRG